MPYNNNIVVGIGWPPEGMRGRWWGVVSSRGLRGFQSLSRSIFEYIFSPFPRRRRADKIMYAQYMRKNRNNNEKTEHEPKRKSSRW